MREVTLYEVTQRQVLCEDSYVSFDLIPRQSHKDIKTTRVYMTDEYLLTKVDQPVHRVRIPPNNRDFYFAIHPKIEEIISCKYREEIVDLNTSLNKSKRELLRALSKADKPLIEIIYDRFISNYSIFLVYFVEQ
jgi:hypothetical protein